MGKPVKDKVKATKETLAKVQAELNGAFFQSTLNAALWVSKGKR